MSSTQLTRGRLRRSSETSGERRSRHRGKLGDRQAPAAARSTEFSSRGAKVGAQAGHLTASLAAEALARGVDLPLELSDASRRALDGRLDVFDTAPNVRHRVRGVALPTLDEPMGVALDFR